MDLRSPVSPQYVREGFEDDDQAVLIAKKSHDIYPRIIITAGGRILTGDGTIYPASELGTIISGQGPRGYSAYEVATQQGFVGDVTAWLLSLHGADGQNGENGLSGTPQTIRVDFSAAETWSHTHSLGQYPSVTCIDIHGVVIDDPLVTYVDDNTVTAQFNGAVAGSMLLN